MQQLPEPIKYTFDAASVGAALAAILGWIPHITAFLGIVWFAMRVYGEYIENKVRRTQLKIRETELRNLEGVKHHTKARKE